MGPQSGWKKEVMRHLPGQYCGHTVCRCLEGSPLPRFLSLLRSSRIGLPRKNTKNILTWIPEAHTLTLEVVARYHLTVMVVRRCHLPVCNELGTHTKHTNMFMDGRPLHLLELAGLGETPQLSYHGCPRPTP